MANEPLIPCPFCAEQPWFAGDTSEWHDEGRYVQLSIRCCIRMTEAIGWKVARDMTVEARTAQLQASLTKRWNTRKDQDEELKGLLRSSITALEVLRDVAGLQPFLPGLPGLIERSKEAVK